MNPVPIRIEKIEKGNLEEAAGLIERAYSDNRNLEHLVLKAKDRTHEAIRRRLFEAVSGKEHMHLIRRTDSGELVGYMTAVPRKGEDGAADIMRLILFEHQNQGIGLYSLKKQIEFCKSMGFRRLIASTSNEYAERNLRKAGFSKGYIGGGDEQPRFYPGLFFLDLGRQK